ncbi:TetR family transcriptional regulator [Cellvibrio zantedeschiae]|uniref:TetR family transcriptional regulator n=1 Tax=Cellvibrio zantedeschiae TaxID=1237077 RepID=A0ABQ3B4G8_9GAMM|nr:TetR family transcriptional regulator [Cellvibrio zantedeschiae]GGY77945.1 TetR family transcriptional regulator [Cellvibrio zantedeschiae]
MARKTKEDAIETRNQLLDAAEKVFFEKGFGQTSLMDIAEAAGLSRGAIYWHFKNKSDLLEAMADRVRLPLENLTDACADQNEPNPLGKLRDFWIQVLRDTTRNPRRKRVLSILLFKCELNSEAKQLEIRRQTASLEYLQDIEQCLKNAIDKGQLPTNLNVHQAAIANHALITGLISNWLFLPGSFDLDNYAEVMIDSYLFMLKNNPELRVKE